ncbi:hypothetical protein pb186bvf_020771 [Paramecium bursaria]
MNDIYQAEVSFYGVSQYLQDFYQSLGLKENSQTLFFMGGEDNLNTKIFLQNYLQLVWADMNYTFITSVRADILDAKTVQGNNDTLGNANIQLQPSNTNCMIFQIITSGEIRAGFYNYQNSRYTVAQNGTFVYNGDPVMDNTYCFNYFEQDIIEIQCDQSTEQFIFKKYSIDYTNLDISIYNPLLIFRNSKIQIKFPFQFSQKYKHTYLAIQNQLEVSLTQSPIQDIFYYAQVWPNLNQNEANFTLNFYIQSVNQAVAIGLCNQDVVNKNGNTYTNTDPYGSGVYMWNSGGYYWHSSKSSYNNKNQYKQFGQGHTISVTYTKQNSSIQYYKNSLYQLSVPIDKIKNLNFCISMQATGTVVKLVY